MYRPRVRKLLLKRALDPLVPKRVAAGAALLVADSEVERADLVEAGVDPGRIAVRPSPFPPFRPGRTRLLRDRIGLGDEPLVLYGRPDRPRQGHRGAARGRRRPAGRARRRSSARPTTRRWRPRSSGGAVRRNSRVARTSFRRGRTSGHSRSTVTRTLRARVGGPERELRPRRRRGRRCRRPGRGQRARRRRRAVRDRAGIVVTPTVEGVARPSPGCWPTRASRPAAPGSRGGRAEYSAPAMAERQESIYRDWRREALTVLGMDPGFGDGVWAQTKAFLDGAGALGYEPRARVRRPPEAGRPAARRAGDAGAVRPGGRAEPGARRPGAGAEARAAPGSCGWSRRRRPTATRRSER